MTLEIKNGELPEDVQDIVRGGKCIAFIGSGPSSRSYDAWFELVNRLCDRCGIQGGFDDASSVEELLEGAQRAREADTDAYNQYLCEHFGRHNPDVPYIYTILLSIQFKSYLTVNFDPLLARQAIMAKIPCEANLHVFPALDRARLNNRTITYLHGYIAEGSTATPRIVLAKDDFVRAYENGGIVANVLSQTFENDPVVFLGCELREPAIEKVLGVCKQHQEYRIRCMIEQGSELSQPPHKFIFLPFPEVSRSDDRVERNVGDMETKEQHYSGMNIRVVWFDRRGDYKLLESAFLRLADLPPIVPQYGWGEEQNVR